MTVPTQIANAMASPPAMVRPGWLSIRPPSLRSSENASNQARPRPSRSSSLCRSMPPKATRARRRASTASSPARAPGARSPCLDGSRFPSSCATPRHGGRTAGAGARGIPRANSFICSAHGGCDTREVTTTVRLITLRNRPCVCSCRCREKRGTRCCSCQDMDTTCAARRVDAALSFDIYMSAR